jgi:hypothetical protein
MHAMAASPAGALDGDPPAAPAAITGSGERPGDLAASANSDRHPSPSMVHLDPETPAFVVTAGLPGQTARRCR